MVIINLLVFFVEQLHVCDACSDHDSCRLVTDIPGTTGATFGEMRIEQRTVLKSRSHNVCS